MSAIRGISFVILYIRWRSRGGGYLFCDNRVIRDYLNGRLTYIHLHACFYYRLGWHCGTVCFSVVHSRSKLYFDNVVRDMVFCGLDSAGVWLIDKYLENAPVNAPFARTFIGVSADHKIKQINRNINSLKNECTGVETQLRKAGAAYRAFVEKERKIWKRLDKQSRIMRGESPDFDNIFCAGIRSKRREMAMYKGRLQYLRNHLTEEENTRSNIVVARNTAGTSLTPVNLEGFFRAVNRIDDAAEPLMGSMGMGDNQLDFQLRMTNTSNAGGNVETDDSFKRELIRMLMSDDPIDVPEQTSVSLSVDADDEGYSFDSKAAQKSGGSAIMSDTSDLMAY